MSLTGKRMKDFHPAFGIRKRIPAELAIQSVCVTCSKSPAAQTLQIRMSMNCFHQPFAEPIGAIIFVDKDIAEIGEDGIVTDDTREADLPFIIIQTKYKRVGKRAFRAFTRAPFCPVGACEKIDNRVPVQPRRICTDCELITMNFDDLGHGVSLSYVLSSMLCFALSGGTVLFSLIDEARVSCNYALTCTPRHLRPGQVCVRCKCRLR